MTDQAWQDSVVRSIVGQCGTHDLDAAFRSRRVAQWSQQLARFRTWRAYVACCERDREPAMGWREWCHRRYGR